MKNQKAVKNLRGLTALGLMLSGLLSIQFDVRAASLSDAVGKNSPPSAGVGTTELLQRAAQAIADGNLVRPAGRSAVDYYAAVLERDPGNTIAQDSMRELLPVAVGTIEQMINSGQANSSLRVLGLFSRVDPKNQTLVRLRERATAVLMARG